MVLTPSQMLPLGTAAPDFDLPDAAGARHSLARTKGSKAYLVWGSNSSAMAET